MRHWRRFPASWRLLPALLTLLWQISGGGPSQTTHASRAAAVAAVPICHSDQAPLDTPAPPHPDTCLLCPICIAAASHPALMPHGPASPRTMVSQPSARAAVAVATPFCPPHRTGIQPRAPPADQA